MFKKSPWLKKCNLCEGRIINLWWKKQFGPRCISCRSTFVNRAAGKVMDDLDMPKESRVYELSARGPWLAYLKRKFDEVQASEFLPDVKPGEFLNQVQCQDVQQLTFPDSSFNILTSIEVFEHVPDDMKGFKEVHRVLKKDGLFLFTVPIFREETQERASIENGEIIHHLPPEYHGDPIRKEGILAYRNYGYDITNRLRKAGFVEVEVLDILDYKHAIFPSKRVVKARKA